MPLISVIVPIYNVATYLQSALNSLEAQTFQDFECILVDDGSTDRSADIAASFIEGKPKFRLIRQKNKGLSGARNTGLAEAKGQFVFFLDSDDWLHPQALEFLYGLAVKHNAQIVSAFFVPTQELFKEPVLLPFLGGKVERYESTDPLLSFLKDKNVSSNACTKLYAMSVIQKTRFIEGIYFEDVPFNTMVFEQAERLLITDAPVYYYYTNPSSIMRSQFTEKKIDSYVRLIREIHGYISRHRPEVLPLVQKNILNKRVKMMFNQAVRKQKDPALRQRLFEAMCAPLQALKEEKIISYKGLKWHHKVILFLLLRHRPTAAKRFMQLIKFSF